MEDSLPSEPLVGVSSPLSLLPRVTTSYDVVSIMFFVIFALWAIYTIVAIYHWVRYGHGSWIAVPAIAAHLFVSAVLMLFAISGFM